MFQRYLLPWLLLASDKTKLSGPDFKLSINDCLFDKVGVINMDGKRFKQCGTYEYDHNDFNYKFKMVCKNINDTYSYVDIDLNKFFTVKDGVAKCSKK